MLETVRSYIASDLPCISFEEYYVNYMMRMQDQNIDDELRFLLRNNFMDATVLDTLIESTYKGMIS